jgi:hypothetical protein
MHTVPGVRVLARTEQAMLQDAGVEKPPPAAIAGQAATSSPQQTASTALARSSNCRAAVKPLKAAVLCPGNEYLTLS